MSEGYRVGVIGCGWVGVNRHIPSYKRDDRTNVVGIYDHKIEKARDVANSHDVPHAFDDLNEFLASDLDIVSICTPPWTHSELAIRALESSAHVLTEKPMAMSIADAEAMVETAERTGNRLGVVHNFLYARSMRKARRVVESGDAGEIKTVMGFQTSSPNRHLPTWYPKLPGGLFYDESPHLLYLIEDFLGDLDVEHVSTHYDPDAVQSLQMVDASIRGEDGTLGTLNMLFDAPISEWHLTIVGTEKLLVADIFRDILLTFDKETAHNITDVVGTSFSAMFQESTGMVASAVNQVQGTLLFGMGELVSSYLDAIDAGEKPPVDGEEGLRIVRAMHDVLEEASIDEEWTGPEN